MKVTVLHIVLLLNYARGIATINPQASAGTLEVFEDLRAEELIQKSSAPTPPMSGAPIA